MLGRVQMDLGRIPVGQTEGGCVCQLESWVLAGPAMPPSSQAMCWVTCETGMLASGFSGSMHGLVIVPVTCVCHTSHLQEQTEGQTGPAHASDPHVCGHTQCSTSHKLLESSSLDCLQR